MKLGPRPASIALRSFVGGGIAVVVLQVLVRLPWNWFLSVVFLYFSIKTAVLFVVLRPDGSGSRIRTPTLSELGLLFIANPILIYLAAALAHLSTYSPAVGVVTAAALYTIGYVWLSKRLAWHPFAAG